MPKKMLQRLPFGAPSNFVPQRFQQSRRYFTIKLQIELDTFLSKGIRQQVFDVQARILYLSLGKINCGALQEFENRH
jgi:hypothetical protein